MHDHVQVVKEVHLSVKLHLWMLLTLQMLEVAKSIFEELSISLSLGINVKEALRLFDILLLSSEPSFPNRIKVSGI